MSKAWGKVKGSLVLFFFVVVILIQNFIFLTYFFEIEIEKKFIFSEKQIF